MYRRITAAAAAAVVLSVAAMTAAANGAGAPPPPKSTTGAPVALVAAGLYTPTSFAFGKGAIFEGDGGSESSKGPPNGGVFVLDHGKGVRIPHSPQFVAGLAWHRGTLYVSGGSLTGPNTATWQLLAWSGWNGRTFTRRQTVYTAPKRFQGFNGLAYGPDGRLYVGVDVGLTDNNDHGPATISPHVYEVLSLAPSGAGLKVVARGIRQPWQIVFPAGSDTPLVSDLAQDKGAAAKSSPDLVLKIHPGDNYGFPKCTWLPGSPCGGFTQPFMRFPAHTDIMGLGIVGDRLYMSSFLGPHGKGHGGEVLSAPLTGGAAKPFVTGFVAPVVGLAAHGGWIYIGELTGQVFRVKP
jgi:glucose/arabinose dehydrogenase